MGDTSVVRLKHTIRRVAIVKERIAAGEISLAHVPDVACAVDVLTKWGSLAGGEACYAMLKSPTS